MVRFIKLITFYPSPLLNHQILLLVISDSILRPGFSSIIAGIFVLCLLLSAWNLLGMINAPTSNAHVFYLNRRHSPLHIVSERFLSFGLDTSLLREISSLPIRNEKFVNLARHLAPAYVRVGGTSADCLYINQVGL